MEVYLNLNECNFYLWKYKYNDVGHVSKKDVYLI